MTDRRLAHRIKHGRSAAERAAEQQQRDADAAVGREQRRARPRPELVTHGAVEAQLAMFARLLGRELGLDRAGQDRHLVVVQRCRACRNEIVSRVPTLEGTAWSAGLGALIRHDYHVHLCPPVAIDTAGYTYEQIDDLTHDTERDLERVQARLKSLLEAYPEQA